MVDVDRIGSSESDDQAGNLKVVSTKSCVVKIAYDYCMSSYSILCMCCLMYVFKSRIQRSRVLKIFGWSHIYM